MLFQNRRHVAPGARSKHWHGLRSPVIAGLTLSVLTALLALSTPSRGAEAEQITGAGATFPFPIYARWSEAAKAATGIELNYQAVGSSSGQTLAIDRTVDFGTSDTAVDPRRLAEHDLLQFPTVLGAVVPIVNLPGIAAAQLRLTGEILAEIYIGRVTRWNDQRLVDLNPDLSLPDLAIAPVFRADGSGTTSVFTTYLSDVSTDWKARVGSSASVRWLAGHGARGNDGVAATVKLVNGSIGYVEDAYAARGGLTTVRLRNRAGNFVEPSITSFTAAAAAVEWKGAPDYLVNPIDTDDANAWPIVSATFVLVPRDPKDAKRASGVLRFFDFAFRNGTAARDLNYITLPVAVQDAIRQTWRTEIHAPDGTQLTGWDTGPAKIPKPPSFAAAASRGH